jgi:voltage-gated potassium channel Kch
MNPILRTMVVAAFLFFSCSFTFFHFALGMSWLAAWFYVVATMTNVGFGDASVTARGPLITAGTVTAMLGGIIFTSILIGYVSSAITRAQWIAEQGLRRVRASGHVVVCGGGKIGRSVVDLMTAAGKRTVIIDSHPDPSLIRRARSRDVDLLTGDATSDDVLDLCDISTASAVLALTNSDAANLEIALGARARASDVPLVVRMESHALAQATAELFEISTFSPAGLCAPAFAGLSRYPGTRGRVRVAGATCMVVQRVHGAEAHVPEGGVPLCVWRDHRLQLVREFGDVAPGEPVLLLTPGDVRPNG